MPVLVFIQPEAFQYFFHTKEQICSFLILHKLGIEQQQTLHTHQSNLWYSSGMYTNRKRKKTEKECKLLLIFPSPSPSLAPGEVECDSRGLRISFVRI